MIASILIAARNEEKNLEVLLESLLQQNFSSFEILIANDESTDQTAKIITDFENKSSTIKGFLINKDIKETYPKLKGKTRALAYLATQAKGTYFLITDADMFLPPNWAKNMIEAFTGNIGVVTGVTLVKPSTLFAKCQAIEWLSAIKMMHTLSKLNIKTTAMGNNMAVSKEAYLATGGYNNFKFSIVEDYELYNQITKKGFDYSQLYKPSVVGITNPPDNYFEQRKRWITGGIQSGSILNIPSILQAFLLPILLVLLFINSKVALLILAATFLMNLALAVPALVQINQIKLLPYIPIYTLYMIFFWCAQFVYYLSPAPLIWKERNY